MKKKYFILESVSEDGTCYLVNGWSKSYHFFTRRVLPENYFKTRAGALKSWESILNAEPCFANDHITIKEVDILGNEVF